VAAETGGRGVTVAMAMVPTQRVIAPTDNVQNWSQAVREVEEGLEHVEYGVRGFRRVGGVGGGRDRGGAA